VTGDVTQTDLPAGQESGLRVASRILNNVSGVAFTHLDKSDIVRHSIVQRIIEAYEKNEGTT
jgi:phosphate starvation-inducible PhoH-like protein